MVKRSVTEKIISYAHQYPVVTITGPRQSGKTTLCKYLFKDKAYFSLEDLNTRQYAQSDPIGFLKECVTHGAVIDEIQRLPDLLSFIQGIVDDNQKNGLFILTGSQNFQLMSGISQSLAGRTALVTLLPFSYEEVYENKKIDIPQLLYKGFYPRIFDQNLNPTEALSFYVSTYIERDVRSILEVRNLNTFETFLKLCAARTGQILNLSSLGNDCGLNHNTVKQWINVLETSHVIFLLRPHFKNFSKRLIKSPKLYFIDVGLACYLLEIENQKQIQNHPLKGSLFETFVVAELLKKRFNSGKKSNLFYFRDNIGNEVNIIIDKGLEQIPIEVKSSQTIYPESFKNINYYYRLNLSSENKGILIYGGSEKQNRTNLKIVPYPNISNINL